MVLFLLKSAACLAIFMAFYKLALENERMHSFKRAYLIGALVLSFTIPSITFVEYVEVVPPVSIENFEPTTEFNAALSASEKTQNFEWLPIVTVIYVLGVLVFLFRFLRNLRQIQVNISTNPKLRMQSLINVLLKDGTVPHTFFNYIFLNKRKFEAKEIPEEILLHESAHAKQKHSLDILFIELLQVIFWFNPLVYIIKNWIRLNHEFLADQAVLNHGTSTPHYQNILLEFASSTNRKDNQSSLANAINYSSIKKRFTVMKKNTSKNSVVLRSFSAIPLITVLLLGFSEQVTLPKEEVASAEIILNDATEAEIAQYNQLAKKYNAIAQEKRKITPEDLKTLELIYRKMSEKQKKEAEPFPECPETQTHKKLGACSDQITEYNTLAKKYNAMIVQSGNIHIRKKDVDRMQYLYALMTTKQRASAESFPDFPKPPAPPTPPGPPEETVSIADSNIEVVVNEQRIVKILENKEIYDEVSVVEHLNQHTDEINPHIIKAGYIQMPPNPPEPKTPLKHAKEMAKKDAVFYLEDEEITAEKAIKILKKNKNINIDSRSKKGQKPQVRLSVKPIEI
ncbi:M56 family metallopeptidase [Zobellia roscoffensis]|uniref:M56 family metallopeptidase n=1 Tax=Zobellia roscoffensis TaxID=2779508 RepID=UPI00188DB070|nr:M56 family metallopeptidase [Zobellia roscoffensis]